MIPQPYRHYYYNNFLFFVDNNLDHLDFYNVFHRTVHQYKFVDSDALGSGTFATVYKALNEVDEEVAIKIVKSGDNVIEINDQLKECLYF